MVTPNECRYIGFGEYWFDFVGLSTDEKPTETYNCWHIYNGSLYQEMDTGELYYYDADKKTWSVCGGGA